MAKTSRYPRTLYKRSETGKMSFTNKKHRDIRYDTLIVENQEEQDEAERNMGYVDNFEEALFKPPKSKEKEKDAVLDKGF